MKDKMENLFKNILIWLFILLLISSVIATGINEYDYRKKDQQIDSLKYEITELKSVDRYGIIITKDTLKIFSDFEINHEPYKFPHIVPLKKDSTKYDCALNDHTRLDIIITKN